jgi:hypothetical protein
MPYQVGKGIMLWCVLVSYFVIYQIASAAETDSLHKALPTLSEQDVLKRVLEFTGFFSNDGLSLEQGTALAELLPIDSAHITLLRDSMICPQIYHISLKDVQVPTIYTMNNPNTKKQRDFEIWVDACCGSILRIYSNTMDSVSNLKYKPYFLDLENNLELQENPNPRSINYPSEVPKFTLTKVLETSIDDLLRPTEISAYYVSMSRLGNKPMPCWIINLTGIPPTERGGSKTNYNLNHLEKVIDVRTGGMLYATFYSAPRH